MRIAIVIYLVISTTMVLLSFSVALTTETQDAKETAYYTLLYQLALYGPAMLMMWPLVFFISQLEDYLSTYYGNVTSLG